MNILNYLAIYSAKIQSPEEMTLSRRSVGGSIVGWVGWSVGVGLSVEVGRWVAWQHDVVASVGQCVGR